MFNIAKATEKLIIEFDYNSTGRTSIGTYEPSWNYYKTLWASITGQKGSIAFDSEVGSVDYRDTISFYLMYEKDFTNKKAFRVQYQNKTYTIQNITVVQPHQATVLDCISVS